MATLSKILPFNVGPTIADYWTINHTPAAATQATKTKAAGAAGVSHVAKRVLASLAPSTTIQTPLTLNLIDGASAGTASISWSISNLADVVAIIDCDNIGLLGTAATAMTIEFSAAGVAASQESVTLIGYDVS